MWRQSESLEIQEWMRVRLWISHAAQRVSLHHTSYGPKFPIRKFKMEQGPTCGMIPTCRREVVWPLSPSLMWQQEILGCTSAQWNTWTTPGRKMLMSQWCVSMCSFVVFMFLRLMLSNWNYEFGAYVSKYDLNNFPYPIHSIYFMSTQYFASVKPQGFFLQNWYLMG